MIYRKKKLVWSIALVLSFGSSQAQINAELNLIDLDGSNGVRINGVNADYYSGRSVNFVGDITGDGIDDVIIGAYGADPNGNSFSGSSYVVFGSNAGIPNPFDLASLDGNNGFVVNGIAVNDFSGSSVMWAI